MATTTNTFATEGIDGFPVEIEVSSIHGFPCLSIIGLPDQAVKEAGDRIRAAIIGTGYKFPETRLIINLAPGDIKKRGSHYDLGMCIALLQESGQIKASNLTSYGFIGELSLNGLLRPCNGILSMVLKAKQQGLRNIILPEENLAEALLIKGMNIFGAKSLKDVIDLLENRTGYAAPDISMTQSDILQKSECLDFSEVRGQDELIKSIVLGVSGGHNILMIGEPGCGKTMIAERIPTIMPTMTEDEALDITKIYSISGLLTASHALMSQRPFRAPHHNASLNALIGGGNPAMPGEVSLAHNGVLFLDELPEFSKSVLEALRQPMEGKQVTIARVNGTNTYPADFMFVAAMNPCPCGYYPSGRCRCSDYEIKHYRNKISGPILERIDIQKNVRPVDYFNMSGTPSTLCSRVLRDTVEEARSIQKNRYKDYAGILNNSQMTPSMIREFCSLDPETESLLRSACDKNHYSARVINKLLRMARTSADIHHSDNIRKRDILNVLSCRDLDNSTGNLYTIE